LRQVIIYFAKNKTPLLLVPVLLFFILSTTSCYIHNSAKEELASNTSKTFGDITSDDNDLKAKMLSNKLKLEEIEDQRLKELKEETINVLALQAWGMTWDQILHGSKVNNLVFIKGIDQLLEDLDSEQQDSSKKVENILKQIAASQGQKNQAKSELESAKKLLKVAAQNRNKWFAKHELFRASIKTISEISVSDELNPDFDTAKDLILRKNCQNSLMKS